MPLLKSLITTIRHPYYTIETSKLTAKRKFINVIRIFAFQFTLAIILGIIVTIITSSIGSSVDQNKVVTFVDNSSILTVIFLSVIYAPILEEITFRLFLVYSPFRLGISISFIILFILNILEQFNVLTISLVRSALQITNPIIYAITYIIFGLAIGFAFGAIIKRLVNQEKIRTAFTKAFPVLFYVSAIVFGVAHISNFTDIKNIWYLTPIIVAPQLVIGFILAYVRTSYGLKWSVLLHGMHNGVTLIPALLLKLSSNNLTSGLDNINSATSLSQSDLLIFYAIVFYVISVFLFVFIVDIQLIVEAARKN